MLQVLTKKKKGVAGQFEGEGILVTLHTFFFEKELMTLIDQRLKISKYKSCNVNWIGLQLDRDRKTKSRSLG